MLKILRTAVVTALFGASLCLSVSAQPIGPTVHLTQARNLHAMRTRLGYRLFGELVSSNTCMNTRFVHTAKPNLFDAQEYRRPGPKQFCAVGIVVDWKKTMIAVVAPHAPKNVYVREAGGSIIKVHVDPPAPNE